MNSKVKLMKRTRSGDYYLYMFMTLDAVYVYHLVATREAETGMETESNSIRYYLLSRTIVGAGSITPKVDHYTAKSFTSLGSFVRKAKKGIENES